MREHIQISIGTGLCGPIIQRFDATTADLLLGLGPMFKLAAAKLGPGTIIIGETPGKLFDGDALPIPEAALAYTDIRMHFETKRIGEGMSRGRGTPEI